MVTGELIDAPGLMRLVGSVEAFFDVGIFSENFLLKDFGSIAAIVENLRGCTP